MFDAELTFSGMFPNAGGPNAGRHAGCGSGGGGGGFSGEASPFSSSSLDATLPQVDAREAMSDDIEEARSCLSDDFLSKLFSKAS